MMRLCLLSLGLILGCVSTASANFEVGETLTFAVKWNGVTVGDTTLKYWGVVDYKNQSLLKITSVGQTFKYEGTDTIYADPETFLPVLVQRDLIYLGQKEFIEEMYEPKFNRVTIRKRVDGITTEEVIQKDVPLSNSILLYYLTRMQNKTKGEKLQVTLPTKDYEFRIIEGKKKQRQKTWEYRSSPRGVRIWVAQEEPHIPLKMVFTKPLSVVTMVYRKRSVEPLLIRNDES